MKSKINYLGNSGNWESGQPVRDMVLHRDEGLHRSFKAQVCLLFVSSHGSFIRFYVLHCKSQNCSSLKERTRKKKKKANEESESHLRWPGAANQHSTKPLNVQFFF